MNPKIPWLESDAEPVNLVVWGVTDHISVKGKAGSSEPRTSRQAYQIGILDLRHRNFYTLKVKIYYSATNFVFSCITFLETVFSIRTLITISKIGTKSKKRASINEHHANCACALNK